MSSAAATQVHGTAVITIKYFKINASINQSINQLISDKL